VPSGVTAKIPTAVATTINPASRDRPRIAALTRCLGRRSAVS
jgi:hypothetical protein